MRISEIRIYQKHQAIVDGPYVMSTLTLTSIVATVKPNLLESVWAASNYIEEHYDPENPIRSTDAIFTLPTGRGLGVNPQEDRISTLQSSFN